MDAFRPIAARIEADLATIGGDASVTYREPNGAGPLDRMSIAEWLDRAGVAGWMRTLLSVGYTTEYGLEPDRQSALNLLLMIDPAPDPFKIYGDSDERYHVRGGNDLIVGALARRLESSIETGSVLEAVSTRAGGGFRLDVRRGGATRAVDADEVVLALPFTLLRDVRLDVELPPAKRKAIAELGYGTNAKLMVGFDERVWRTAHRSNGSVLADLPFQSTWETSRAQRGRSGVLTNFTGGAQGVAVGEGTARAQADRVARELEAVFPGVGRGASRREGGPLPLAVAPVDERQLRVLPRRPVDDDRGRGGRERRPPPLRGRALLAGGAGLHGGRLRDGRGGRARRARGPRIPAAALPARADAQRNLSA